MLVASMKLIACSAEMDEQVHIKVKAFQIRLMNRRKMFSMDSYTSNLCMRCGACCAAFRVNLTSSEVIDGRVPIDFTVSIGELQYAMRGTEQKQKRCCALKGQIGHWAICSIYASRPSSCRNFNASWTKGAPNENCDRARAFYGLVPFGDF
jgi:Fe-S-cluster containining protein